MMGIVILLLLSIAAAGPASAQIYKSLVPGTYTISGGAGTFLDRSKIIVGNEAPPAVAPNIEETYSSYTTVNQYATRREFYDPLYWSGWNWSNPPRSYVSFQSPGFPPYPQSVRYTMPNRTTDPYRCDEYVIGRRIDLPPVPSGPNMLNISENVWLELWVKYDSGYQNLPPVDWYCGTNNCWDEIAQDHDCAKSYYMEIVTVNMPGFGEKFVIFGSWYGDTVAAGFVSAYYMDRPLTFVKKPVNILDGKWHRYRAHMKGQGTLNGCFGVWCPVDPTKPARFTMWFDNELVGSGQLNSIAPMFFNLWIGNYLPGGSAQEQGMNIGRIRIWTTNPGWQ
jgi:hypothetical protein